MNEIALELNFEAIFIVYGVVFSTLTIQYFSDILASKTGHPKGDRRSKDDP